ncbi:TonB-dependent receptor [Fodinibius salsisoli]|uniref:TonB-dependent receptor n=1 Tax=Fodinibius salsisoli TaxID=2820877 RepID=A0ABT3PJK3_9BACT|nr:TonB-dependent receptor [Fodinibius salsisoli]MCW9705923.1 TonB-dependent receptor [Fodinibius salsisoli]
MQKTITLIFTLSLMTLTGFAQQAEQFSVTGKITNPNGEPVENANVLVENTSHGASTETDGTYEISEVARGEYTFVISSIGFQRYSRTIEVDRNITLNATLKGKVEAMSEVTVSGSRIETYDAVDVSPSLRLNEDLIDVPQNIQVVTRDLLEDQQTVDMLESVSRNVSGAQMIEHWGNFARINMRGFRIPAFRNGMNVQFSWGPLTEDMVMVDRIEFVKGPSAFMLSSGEPGGLYNVSTKKPTGETKGKVSLMAGSFNTLRTSVDLDGSLSENDRLLYRLNAAGTTENSHREYGFNDRYTVAPSLRYVIDENTTITGQYSLQYSKMYIGSGYVFSPDKFASLPRDFSIFDPRIDPAEMKEHFAYVNLKHQLNNNWSITGKIGYLDYHKQGSSIWPASVAENGDIIRRLSSSDSRNQAKLGQLFLTGKEQTGGISHSILVGLDLGYKNLYADWNQSDSLDTEENPFNVYNPSNQHVTIPTFNRERSLRNRAGTNIINSQYHSYYIQDQLGFFDDRLRVTLAGRLTDYKSSSYGATTEDKVFSPRAAVSFSITENTSIYGLYDQSFVPQTGQTFDGEAFDPERGNDIEGGIKKSWGGGNWSSTFTYYHMTKENILTGDPENPNYSIQLGEAESKGFEFDVHGEVVDGLSLLLNYANTDVTITEDTNPENVGDRLAGHARHMTNGWLKYTFASSTPLNGVGLSLGYQYQVDRSSWNWGSDNESYLPDYFRLDGGLSWSTGNYDINLNINNLLDEYLYSGADYGSYVYWQSEPGRNFRLSVSYAF